MKSYDEKNYTITQKQPKAGNVNIYIIF